VPRRAARIDDNQPAIVKLFRSLGCSVACTHTAGDGFPDLVVGQWGVNALVEVKDPEKPPSKRTLTQAQVKFHDGWRGTAFVVETDQDVIKLVTWMRISSMVTTQDERKRESSTAPPGGPA